MIEGFYRIAFTGTAGSGFGVLVFRTGTITGADVAGAIFDGSYTENPTTRVIDFKVTMSAPAGVTPVQTGIALVTPLNLPITGSVATNDIGGDKPILLQTPLGPINALFRKIRDFP
jgi:hypothetical protein